MTTYQEDCLFNSFARYQRAHIPLRDVRRSMKLHGDTVFIHENQEMSLENGCIINWLDGEVRVNVEAREQCHEEANREGRDEGLVCLVCLVYSVCLVCPVVRTGELTRNTRETRQTIQSAGRGAGR